jgi:hypothetical protein
MRSLLIEFVSPGSDLPASVPKIPEPLGIQALISEPTVETFDMSVLNWFAGLNVDQFNMLLDTPSEEMARGKFAAIIHSNPFWPATLGDDTVERSRDASTGQTSIHFQSQAFPSKRIDDTQYAHRSTVCHPVVNEVDSPLLVRFRGCE